MTLSDIKWVGTDLGHLRWNDFLLLYRSRCCLTSSTRLARHLTLARHLASGHRRWIITAKSLILFTNLGDYDCTFCIGSLNFLLSAVFLLLLAIKLVLALCHRIVLASHFHLLDGNFVLVKLNIRHNFSLLVNVVHAFILRILSCHKSSWSKPCACKSISILVRSIVLFISSKAQRLVWILGVDILRDITSIIIWLVILKLRLFQVGFSRERVKHCWFLPRRWWFSATELINSREQCAWVVIVIRRWLWGIAFSFFGALRRLSECMAFNNARFLSCLIRHIGTTKITHHALFTRAYRTNIVVGINEASKRRHLRLTVEAVNLKPTKFYVEVCNKILEDVSAFWHQFWSLLVRKNLLDILLRFFKVGKK